MKRGLIVIGILASGLLSGCATVHHAPRIAAHARANWIVQPFANHTETPLAGQRAASIARSLLLSRGVSDAQAYSAFISSKQLLPGSVKPLSVPSMLKWSRRHHYAYAVTGAVNEWRYKVGIDGEPAVGVTMDVWDVKQGRVIWSGVGAQSGTSGQAVSYVGQRLIASIMSSLRLV